MRLCRSKDMQVEPLNEKPYFDAVSEIDLMSDSRLMIIELRDDAFRVLFCNGDLLNSLQELGVESVDDLDDTPVFTGGDIQGALDHVTAVAGRKADFLIHERFLLGGGKRGFPGR